MIFSKLMLLKFIFADPMLRGACNRMSKFKFRLSGCAMLLCILPTPSWVSAATVGNYYSDTGCISIFDEDDSGFHFYSYFWGVGAPGYTCTIKGKARQLKKDKVERDYEFSPVGVDENTDEASTCHLLVRVTSRYIILNDVDGGCSHGNFNACGVRALIDDESFVRKKRGLQTCRQTARRMNGLK